MFPIISDLITKAFPPPAPDATPTLFQKIVNALTADIFTPELFNDEEQQKLVYARTILQMDAIAIKFKDDRKLIAIAAYERGEEPVFPPSPDDEKIIAVADEKAI